VAVIGGIAGKAESMLQGVAAALDECVVARPTGLSRPLRLWIDASLGGVILSVVLLGHITETQPFFYAVMGMSLVVYLMARGEALVATVIQYLTSPATAWRWAFFAWAALSLLWTARGGLAVDRVITLFEIQVVGLVFFDAARNLGRARWMLTVVLVCTVAATVYALTSEDPLVSLRLAGAYRNPNTLGIVAVIGMAVCFAVMGELRRFCAVAASSVAVLLLSVGVLASSSLKGIAGTAFVIAGSLFFARTRRHTLSLLLIGAVAVAALVLTVEPMKLLWEHTVDRVEVTITNFETAADVGQSITERSRFIGKGLELMAESPVVGTGLSTFKWLSDEGTYAHNNFIEVGVSLGVVGILLFYAFHATMLVRLVGLGRRGGMVWRFALLFIPMIVLLDVASVSYAHKLSSLLLIMCAGWLDRVVAEGRGNAGPAEGRASA
jgi:O-antigen ligase